MMNKRLKVHLLPGWRQYEQQRPSAPSTFIRAERPCGVLQVSVYAVYQRGPKPRPTEEQLIELAQGHAERHHAGELEEVQSGTCVIGTWGSAVFRSEDNPRIQVWYVSNGCDFILATYICPAEPDQDEVDEAQHIVSWLEFS
jgi:hypothetical protein